MILIDWFASQFQHIHFLFIHFLQKEIHKKLKYLSDELHVKCIIAIPSIV